MAAWFTPLSRWFGVIGAGLALLTGFMTFASVCMRAMFQSPISGDVELTQMGIALAISMCLPWCQCNAATSWWTFSPKKVQPSLRFMDSVGCLALAVMYGFLAWRTSVGAVSVREAGETTMIISLPMWWAYASLAPGLALSALIALAQTIDHWTTPLNQEAA
ncbi:MAG: TRAP transporter small permease subunit [Betaproteobacteria bacterium]|nr:TRAP transporter small permease subunit [Betaproteobacteria bacterium]